MLQHRWSSAKAGTRLPSPLRRAYLAMLERSSREPTEPEDRLHRATYRTARPTEPRAISVIKDKLRTLLNIRVKREAPAMGTKPRMGAKIVLGGMRMGVTSTPPDELWYFFSLQGWREITHPRDRRKYVELPRSSFDQLARCNSHERELRYRQLMMGASRKGSPASAKSPASSALTSTRSSSR